jgi:hypothetical protein
MSDMFRPRSIVEAVCYNCGEESMEDQTEVVRIEYRSYDGSTVQAVIVESKSSLRKIKSACSYGKSEECPLQSGSSLARSHNDGDDLFDNTIPVPPDDEGVEAENSSVARQLDMEEPDAVPILGIDEITVKTNERTKIINDLERHNTKKVEGDIKAEKNSATDKIRQAAGDFTSLDRDSAVECPLAVQGEEAVVS